MAVEAISFIEEELRLAGEHAMGRWGLAESWVSADDPNQVVTDADVNIGRMLIKDISKAFPGDNVIDEEAGVIYNGSERTWVIDDIDGTSNFSQGLPQFGHMLSLLEGGEVVAAGIFLPAQHNPAMYLAERGSGAYENGTRLAVDPNRQLQDVLVAYGIDVYPDDPAHTLSEFTMMARIAQRSRSMRCNNSIYDVCNVATGGYGASLTKTDRLWDCTAADLILTEAGALYTGFDGRPNDYSNPVSKAGAVFSRCAASPLIHSQLQAIIHGQA